MAGTGGVVRVGIVSDTHGKLPDAAVDALAGVSAIVHAGDIEDSSSGSHYIIEQLEAIAPVTAVRGNCDVNGDASRLDEYVNARIGGVRFLVGHQKARLLREIDPAKARAQVVVTGHSHKANVESVDGILYVNPGSAGANRGSGLSVGIVEIQGDEVRARIVEY